MRRALLIGCVLAAAVAGCSALGDDAGSADSAATAGPGAIQDQLKTATKALATAQAAVAADKERARKETERLAPALKDSELAGYGTAFQAQPAVQANAAAFGKAAEALDGLVAGDPDRKAAIEARAADDDATAAALVAAYTGLAATPFSRSSLSFAVGILAKPDAPLSKRVLAHSNAKDVEETILARALPTVAVVDLASTNDVVATIANLKKLLEPLAASKDTSAILTKLTAIGAALQSHDLDAMALFATADDRAAIQALAAAGISLQLLDAKDDSHAVEVTEAISKVAATSITVVAHAVQSFADAAFFAHHGLALGSALQVTSAEITTLASRLVPALGLIASSMSLILDVQKAASLGGAAEAAAVLAVVGDALAIAGCIVQLTVIGAPAGWVLRSVALAVSFLAHVLADWIENQQLIAEEKACLSAAGIDRSLVSTLATAPPEQLSALGHDLGFDADAIQWMAVTSPDMVLKGEGSGNPLDGLASLSASGKLAPDQALSFLKAALANVGDEDRPEALPNLMVILHGILVGDHPQTTADWITSLTGFSPDVLDHDPATKQEVGDALAWLNAEPAPR